MDLVQDIRYSVRSLLKTPGWTALALAALSLGIGANSAVFSIINAVLIVPLPYRNPQRLVVLLGYNHFKGIRNIFFSLPDYQDIAFHNDVFQQTGAYQRQSMVLTGTDAPQRIEAASVSPNLFPLLGTAATLGRLFLPDEDQPGKNNVTILSSGLWRRLFSGDPHVLGSAVRLDSRNYTVIGVMPPEFRLPGSGSELWIPYTPDPADLNPSRRGYRFLSLLARLRAGVTVEQADTEVRAIARRIAGENPDTNGGYSADVLPLRQQMVGDSRPALLMLMGAVGFVLLIACANVANLLLVRSSERQKEIAVRASLGASRSRIVRQLLTESVLLAVIGGCLGLVIAFWASSLLIKLAPASLAPAHGAFIDWRVLGFTLGISVVTGVLFGLAPAWTAAKIDLNSILRGSGRGSGGTRSGSRVRDVLVAWEVAACTLLLFGAGLAIRTYSRLKEVDPGFRTDHVLTMQLAPPPNRYPGVKIALFYRQIIERIESLEGVQSTGLCTFLPLAGNDLSINFQIANRPALTTAEQPRAKFRAASPDYFTTLGIPLIRGRYFNRFDSEATPKVVVINQAAARLYWPNEDPIGQQIRSLDDTLGYTIVGISGNVKHAGLDAGTSPEIYYHYLQIPPQVMNIVEATMALVVLTPSDPAAMASSIRGQIRRIDADQPVFNVETMNQVVQGSVAEPRYRALLLGVFAGLALLLAAIGLYGVIARSVAQRTNELGIRIALGASRINIFHLVVGRTIRLSFAGMIAGLGLGVACGKALARLLFEVSAEDPMTLAAACLLMLAVCWIASFLPVWRVTRTNPAKALRAE